MAGRRGGPRLGAGRKPRWGVPTVAMRVPESLRQEIERFILERLGRGQEPVQEAEVEKLKASNDRLLERAMNLQHQLDLARARIAQLERDLERERTIRVIWPESGGRCQAATKRGARCRRKSFARITVTSNGFCYEIAACAAHYRQHKERTLGRDSAVRVAPELLPK